MNRYESYFFVFILYGLRRFHVVKNIFKGKNDLDLKA